MTVSPDDKKYFLFRSVSEPRSKWVILTGASKNATDEQLLNAFIPVIEKLIKADRPGFGTWHGQNLPEPSSDQQRLLEQQLERGAYDIEIGTVVITFDDQAKEPKINADYYVYAKDPLFGPAVDEASTESLKWLPWTAAVLVGAGVFAVTDKRKPGMRLFASGAGALLGALLVEKRTAIW